MNENEMSDEKREEMKNHQRIPQKSLASLTSQIQESLI
jgi:hypothetical protein